MMPLVQEGDLLLFLVLGREKTAALWEKAAAVTRLSEEKTPQVKTERVTHYGIAPTARKCANDLVPGLGADKPAPTEGFPDIGWRPNNGSVAIFGLNRQPAQLPFNGQPAKMPGLYGTDVTGRPVSVATQKGTVTADPDAVGGLAFSSTGLHGRPKPNPDGTVVSGLDKHTAADASSGGTGADRGPVAYADSTWDYSPTQWPVDQLGPSPKPSGTWLSAPTTRDGLRPSARPVAVGVNKPSLSPAHGELKPDVETTGDITPTADQDQGTQSTPGIGQWWNNNQSWALPAGLAAGGLGAGALYAASRRKKKKRPEDEGDEEKVANDEAGQWKPLAGQLFGELRRTRNAGGTGQTEVGISPTSGEVEHHVVGRGKGAVTEPFMGGVNGGRSILPNSEAVERMSGELKDPAGLSEAGTAKPAAGLEGGADKLTPEVVDPSWFSQNAYWALPTAGVAALGAYHLTGSNEKKRPQQKAAGIFSRPKGWSDAGASKTIAPPSFKPGIGKKPIPIPDQFPPAVLKSGPFNRVTTALPADQTLGTDNPAPEGGLSAGEDKPEPQEGWYDRNWPLVAGGVGLAGAGGLLYMLREKNRKKEQEKQADYLGRQWQGAKDDATEWIQRNPERAHQTAADAATNVFLTTPARVAMGALVGAARAPSGYSVTGAARGAGYGLGAGVGGGLGTLLHNTAGNPDDLGPRLALQLSGSVAGLAGARALMGEDPADVAKLKAELERRKEKGKLKEELKTAAAGMTGSTIAGPKTPSLAPPKPTTALGSMFKGTNPVPAVQPPPPPATGPSAVAPQMKAAAGLPFGMSPTKPRLVKPIGSAPRPIGSGGVTGTPPPAALQPPTAIPSPTGTGWPVHRTVPELGDAKARVFGGTFPAAGGGTEHLPYGRLTPTGFSGKPPKVYPDGSPVGRVLSNFSATQADRNAGLRRGGVTFPYTPTAAGRLIGNAAQRATNTGRSVLNSIGNSRISPAAGALGAAGTAAGVGGLARILNRPSQASMVKENAGLFGDRFRVRSDERLTQKNDEELKRYEAELNSNFNKQNSVIRTLFAKRALDNPFPETTAAIAGAPNAIADSLGRSAAQGAKGELFGAGGSLSGLLGAGVDKFLGDNRWANYAAWGAPIGAAIGGIGGLFNRKKKKNALGDALTGGLLGAATGAAGGMAYDLMSPAQKTEQAAVAETPKVPGAPVKPDGSVAQPNDTRSAWQKTKDTNGQNITTALTQGPEARRGGAAFGETIKQDEGVRQVAPDAVRADLDRIQRDYTAARDQAGISAGADKGLFTRRSLLGPDAASLAGARTQSAEAFNAMRDAKRNLLTANMPPEYADTPTLSGGFRQLNSRITDDVTRDEYQGLLKNLDAYETDPNTPSGRGALTGTDAQSTLQGATAAGGVRALRRLGAGRVSRISGVTPFNAKNLLIGGGLTAAGRGVGSQFPSTMAPDQTVLEALRRPFGGPTEGGWSQVGTDAPTRLDDAKNPSQPRLLGPTLDAIGDRLPDVGGRRILDGIRDKNFFNRKAPSSVLDGKARDAALENMRGRDAGSGFGPGSGLKPIELPGVKDTNLGRAVEEERRKRDEK